MYLGFEFDCAAPRHLSHLTQTFAIVTRNHVAILPTQEKTQILPEGLEREGMLAQNTLSVHTSFLLGKIGCFFNKTLGFGLQPLRRRALENKIKILLPVACYLQGFSLKY